MEKIKDVLGVVLEDLLKRGKETDLEKTQAVWKKIVGSKACAHTKIVCLTKEKIRVNVDSSAWLFELNLKKEAIQKELKKALNIRELYFRLGGIGDGHVRRG